jgi:hypothetical protein
LAERYEKNIVPKLLEQAESTPYASVIMRSALSKPALLVLAYAEPSYFKYPADQALKWVSADQGMIVTQGGRVTKTLMFEGADLYALSSHTPDPLSLGLHRSDTPKQWSFVASWQGFDQIKARSVFNKVSDVWVETVDYASGHRVTNSYWLDADGRVVRSKQQPIPILAAFDVAAARPFGG